MSKYHLPTIGLVLALCLFIVATLYYPGGTTDSTSTIGYNWTENFICALFAPQALNGAINPSRYFAIPSMFFLCVSLATMFKLISNRVKSKVHKSLIEIGGIGAMVYSFLVFTPLHNLMVNIGLVFGLVALLSTTHSLYIERRLILAGWGAMCIAVKLITAVMYYGDLYYNFLPVMQKASLFFCVGWIVAVYYTLIKQKEMNAVAQDLRVQMVR